MLSCLSIGYQVTPHTIGDAEYIRTPLYNLFVIGYHVTDDPSFVQDS